MSNSIIQGESKYLPFLIKSKATGRPMVLTGATFLLHIKTAAEDVVPIISKKDSAFVKTSIAIGQVSVLLTASDTNQLAPWNYYGELRITTSANLVYKIPFSLTVETTGLPDAILDQGVSLSVADQITGT